MKILIEAYCKCFFKHYNQFVVVIQSSPNGELTIMAGQRDGIIDSALGGVTG